MRTELEIARLIERERLLCQEAIEKENWSLAALVGAKVTALQWVLNDR